MRKRDGRGWRGLWSVRSAEGGLPRWSSSSLSSILGRSATKFEGGALRPRANGDFVRLDLRQGRSRGSSTAARGEEGRGRGKEKKASVVAALLRRPASNLRRTRNLLRRKQYRLRGPSLAPTSNDGGREKELSRFHRVCRAAMEGTPLKFQPGPCNRNVLHPRRVPFSFSNEENEISRACNLAASARLSSSVRAKRQRTGTRVTISTAKRALLVRGLRRGESERGRERGRGRLEGEDKGVRGGGTTKE